MAEVTLGSFNLHAGRGTPGHDAPFYDVLAATKEIDTDVLVLQEAWIPDSRRASGGDVGDLADALGYEVAATFTVARASRHDRLRLVARDGTDGEGDWSVAVLSRLPVLSSEVRPLTTPRRDPGHRALLVATVAVDGTPFTVAGTHLPLMKELTPRLVSSTRAALPAPDGPAAFAGDMNMWGWGIGLLTPRGWRRTARGRTYPSHRPHSQTDHILVTPQVHVVESEVLPQAMSDHRPVRARLRIDAP
jgi:endonuclease/exonuclease/phosphatase family metal-dependent hydrolase